MTETVVRGIIAEILTEREHFLMVHLVFQNRKSRPMLGKEIKIENLFPT